jgi:hypothetical protein
MMKARVDTVLVEKIKRVPVRRKIPLRSKEFLTASDDFIQYGHKSRICAAISLSAS